MGEARSVVVVVVVVVVAVEELVIAPLDGDELSKLLLSVFVVLLVPSDEGEVTAKRPVL